MEKQPRLWFVDNFRALAIVGMIILHAAICYMLYAPEWWYVLDPDRSLVFTSVVLVVDVPLMPAMFFAAGYFALPSLERRGSRGFVREKLVHIGIPWVFGVLVLAPLATYMTFVSRGIEKDYLGFWTGEFWTTWFQQSVYWFLGALLAAFLLLTWAWEASPRLQASRPRVGLPRARWLVLFILATAAGSALFAPGYGLDDWQPFSWLLVLQPARIAFYAGYFALGVYAERRGWFRAGGFRPEVAPWTWGAVLTGIAYLAFRLGGNPTTVTERTVASLLFSTFCFVAVIAGLAITQTYLDRAGRAWRTLSASSYGIYYVHPLILYPLAWLLVGVAVPAALKFVVLVVATLLISLAISALVLRRVPGLRRLF
jgi:glucan biosynthesis protein C